MDNNPAARFNGRAMAERRSDGLDEALCKLVLSYQNGRFYGILHLHFEAGRLVRVRKEESVESKDLSRLIAQ